MAPHDHMYVCRRMYPAQATWLTKEHTLYSEEERRRPVPRGCLLHHLEGDDTIKWKVRVDVAMPEGSAKAVAYEPTRGIGLPPPHPCPRSSLRTQARGFLLSPACSLEQTACPRPSPPLWARRACSSFVVETRPGARRHGAHAGGLLKGAQALGGLECTRGSSAHAERCVRHQGTPSGSTTASALARRYPCAKSRRSTSSLWRRTASGTPSVSRLACLLLACLLASSPDCRLLRWVQLSS